VRRLCCPECATRLRFKWSRWTLVAWAVAVPLFIYNYMAGNGGGPGFVLMACAFFFAVQVPLALMHEIGHALAARVVGAAPYAIIIGDKPWLLDRDFLGLRWRFGREFNGGLLYHEDYTGAYPRLGRIWILAGGALMNALIAVVCFVAYMSLPERAGDSLLRPMLMIVTVASTWMCLSGLWPSMVESSAGPMPSDGAQIRDLLAKSADDVIADRSGHVHMKGMFAFEDGDFARARDLGLRVKALGGTPELLPYSDILIGAALCELGDMRGAIEVLESHATTTSANPAVQCFAANNLAWALLHTGEPEDVRRGLELAANARAIVPWAAAAAITEACLLASSATLDNGRAIEAAALLDKFPARPLERRSRAYHAFACGLTAIAQGHQTSAREALERARSLGAGQPSLRLLERRLASG
jgi:hypothetical protein